MRYPQKLCIKCRNRLDTWSKFRDRCLKSQTQYRNEFLINFEISEQPEQNSIKIETVLIKEEPSLSLEMTVETEPVKNNKSEKYWDWSDDDFFAPTEPIIGIQSSDLKLENDESEEEFFELITVEDVDDDNKETVETEVETEIKKTEEMVFNNDKYSSTESEPDCFDFDLPKQPKMARKPKELGKKIKPSGICDICGKILLTQSIQYHLNWHYG